MARKRGKQSNASNTPDYNEIFDYTVFRERLDLLLKQNNMTQIDLANAIEVDKQTVYRWKKGDRKTPIDPKTICKLAKFFRVEEEYLYDPKHLSPHKYQEELDKHLNETYIRNKPFIDFLESVGMRVEILPPHDILINGKQSEEYKLTEESLSALAKKAALFIEMDLL